MSAKEIVRLRREGRVRSLVYRVVARCGLRRNEITRIEIGHVRLDRRTIFVPAHSSKSKRDEEVLLPDDLVRRLKGHVRTLKSSPPETQLFKGRVPSMKRFDRDSAAAGIAKVEGSRFLDFHALRKTYVTHLRSKRPGKHVPGEGPPSGCDPTLRSTPTRPGRARARASTHAA